VNRKIVSRPIKKVTIHFEDNDEILSVDLPPQQGFYRERYSFRQREEDGEAEHAIGIFELYWTIKYNKGAQLRLIGNELGGLLHRDENPGTDLRLSDRGSQE